MVTEACRKNQITVNGQVAKASREVFPMDKITFRKDQITYIVSVLDIPANRVGAKTGRYLPQRRNACGNFCPFGTIKII